MIHRPSWLVLPAIIALAAWWWGGMQQESAALSRHRAELQRQAADLASRRNASSSSFPPPAVQDDARIASIQRDIATEQEQLTKIKRAADALAARLPATQKDELIISFGKIEDMGRETGSAMRDFAALADAAKAGIGSEATTDSIVLRMMQLQGRLPEIRAFEQRPDEIANFQSNALQQALDLTPEATAGAKSLIRTAFSDIDARHLTADDRPEGSDLEWKQQRSAALQGLMQQLRPLLPEKGGTDNEKMALMLVLNLGAGFDQDTKTEPHKATVTWAIKWPEVPW